MARKKREPIDHKAVEAEVRERLNKTASSNKARKPVCGFLKPDGSPCRQPAGWNTDHPGTGKCKYHGGAAQSHLLASAAPNMAILTGYAVDIDPMEALLMCVRITAAEVNFFNAAIAELDPQQLIVRPSKEAMGGKDGHVRDLKDYETLNLFVVCRDKAVESLAKYSKMALDARVDERIVKFTQNLGVHLGKALKGIIFELGLDEEQMERAPVIVRRHMMLLQGGKGKIQDPFEIVDLMDGTG